MYEHVSALSHTHTQFYILRQSTPPWQYDMMIMEEKNSVLMSVKHMSHFTLHVIIGQWMKLLYFARKELLSNTLSLRSINILT
jgi:hypothetical protein